jgi:hypothetical protein
MTLSNSEVAEILRDHLTKVDKGFLINADTREALCRAISIFDYPYTGPDSAPLSDALEEARMKAQHLLDQTAELQAQFWAKLSQLEGVTGFEVSSTQDLNGLTFADLKYMSGIDPKC